MDNSGYEMGTSDAWHMAQGEIRELKCEIERLQRDLADAARLEWLEQQVVDVIYLDDGRIIDVQGHSVRTAIDKARAEARHD